MIDIELLLGEEAVDPRKESPDRKNQENATGGEQPPRENDDSLPNPVRSPERRAEAFLTEWLRRLTRP